MLVRSGRGLAVSGSLLAGSLAVGLLYVLPATRPGVQGVDDAVWRFAGAIRNAPTTAVAVALSWLGSAAVNWPLRVAALILLAWRRHWLRLAAFGLAVITSEVLIGVVELTAVGLVLVLAPPGPERWRVGGQRGHLHVSHGALADVPAGTLAVRHRLRRAAGAGLALGRPALLMAFRHQRDTAAPTS